VQPDHHTTNANLSHRIYSGRRDPQVPTLSHPYLHAHIFPDRLFNYAASVLEERARTRVSVKDRVPGLLRDIMTATKEMQDILQVLTKCAPDSQRP
jgi:hypothetical protein